MPLLISRLPILCGGPLLLERRWLEDGLDTLDGVVGVSSSCDSPGSKPWIRATVVAPTTVGGCEVEKRRLPNQPGDGDAEWLGMGNPGSEGARRIRGWVGWCVAGDPEADEDDA